jgi:hypothetical protein
MGTGSFPGVKSSRGVTLTPHLLLVLLVMKELSYTSTPPVGRTPCTEPQCLYKGCTLPFTQTIPLSCETEKLKHLVRVLARFTNLTNRSTNQSLFKEHKDDKTTFNVDTKDYIRKAASGTKVNLLKSTGYVMHHQFNIQQLYTLPTLYLCVLYLSENSDLCHLQHKLIGFYNRDEKCLHRGTDSVFK